MKLPTEMQGLAVLGLFDIFLMPFLPSELLSGHIALKINGQ